MSDARSPTLLRMALPLVVSFWMRAVVTLVDTVYAAILGDPAVAAIGLTIPFEFLMIAVWVGLSTGLTSGLSRAIGARQGVRIEQYLSAAWRLVAGAIPVFAMVGVGIWVFGHRVGLEAETAGDFRIYGSVLLIGSAVTTFWSIVPDSLVKAHQDTRSTMWAGITTNLINVALNSLFLFVFHWGIFGIALSTVLGRIGGLAYALVRASHHERRRRAEGETPGTERDPSPYRVILSLAVPSSITFGLIALETALINGFLAHMAHPTEAIAAYSIYYRVVLFALQPVIAMSVALLPYAARRFGAGDVVGVRRGFSKAIRLISVYALLILGPLLYFLAPWLAAHLAESPLTRTYATLALRLVPLACVTGAPFLLCRPVFEALGRGKPGLWMAILRYLVLTAPGAWIGMNAARAFDVDPLTGLIGALLTVAALASGIFLIGLRRTLARLETAST